MQAEQTTDQPSPNFDRFSIFLITKNAQNSFGIKQGDYMRYRRYCTRKVDKLRKGMDYKYGNRTKFVKKDIMADKQTDKKILQVGLFMCEKYWAYAHQSKFNQTIKQTNKLRAKFMTIKKFKRAVQWSQKLLRICKQKTDHVTSSEAQSYSYYLQGFLHLEQQQWKEAQTKLIACREIITDLLGNIDTMNAKVYKEKIDQVDQTIKFCNFKISKGQEIPIQQIIQMRKNGQESLANLIGNIAERRMQEMSLGSSNQIRFGEQRYPIKDQKIIQLKSKIDVMLENLEVIKKKAITLIKDDDLFEELLNFFSSTIITVDSAIKMVDTHKENVKQYTQGEIAIYKKIALLFQQLKLKIMIDRNNIIFRRSYLSESDTKKSAPQNLAKLLSNTINIYGQYVQLEKLKSEGTQALDDLQKIRNIDAKIFYYRTLRLYFVGQVYYNNDKIKQAYSLWQECQRCLQSVKSSEQQQIKSELNLIPLDDVSLQLKQNKLKCIIRNYKSNETDKQKLSNQMQQMTMQENALNNTLYELMTESTQAQFKLAEYGQLKPIELPGKMQPIPTRPIFFDIFESTLHYPTLDNKVQKGWFGKLFKR